MTGFDTFVVVDWSARAAPSPRKPTADSVWVAVVQGGSTPTCHYHRTRHDAMAALRGLFDAELAAGRRVLAGFDFSFAYPAGFARALTGSDDPLGLWPVVAAMIEDAPDNANNRFDVARALNARFPGVGPFWGCPAGQEDAVLPARGSRRHGYGMLERRGVELHPDMKRSQPGWKLYTTGSVGSQALLGIPRLQALREHYGDALRVAPFERGDAPLVLAEVYPSLISDVVADARREDEILDRAQVRVLATALSRLAPETLDALLREGDPVEGWSLGVGKADVLRAAARMEQAPLLRNDCFALPPGVKWTRVVEALAHLRERMQPVTDIETVSLGVAAGRIAARDISARRANPPLPNTAVDGYGFAGGRGEGTHRLPLAPGRAAAGDRPGAVPDGQAIRVLTGAALPKGVDTVILQEDVAVAEGEIVFHGPVKTGANTRRAGEDVEAGDRVVPAGRRITAPDLALLAATGVAEVEVRAGLRVGVLSTGDELIEPGEPASDGQIFDANQPMLTALVTEFGHHAVDLGRVGDDRAALRQAFDDAAGRVDVILTSGGASAGDEDHVSALLTETGTMGLWRIAVKPGRPLALGMWQGKPVFGLPGNPVAAMVCTLIFARPALAVLAGGNWSEPLGFDVPAAFSKRKKAGRREYLRARIRDGRAEVFASEGSGRISGLSWAEGLVELPEPAVEVAPGDTVRFIPYGSFGL
ncbi:molybdopterin molybdenumtransferase MoeA [Sulfitobacter alexandrii]|uniref:Molybdopterin molybdenumtransferase n=1 Tax=Sulfitobacter alexandrii TaxID=1917485 RepID=A0A1J0WE86_9RHOB|nr:gephyrin-like molybdotransferase Glp [Sulfitobacter alexandrii]APE42631.1 molybdopterin molybdenumtransferase MoeA [Sulfitobacter alexandrii]